MSHYQPYPAYKDSGVEWLGKVPKHWEVKQLKYLTNHIGSGKTPSGGAEVYQESGVLFLRSQNVHESGLRLDDAVFIREETDEEMKASRVKPLDVLLNITGASIGRSCQIPDNFESANVNQHVCAIRTDDFDLSKWIALCLPSNNIQSQIDFSQNGAGREGLNFEQIGNMVIAIPEKTEIAKISANLDRETARIDSLITKKTRFIELLKEKRQALITQAVTKGLDPHVKMKDSGVEWLGEVPEHWGVATLKRYVVFQRGHDLPVDVREDGCIPVVSSGGYLGTHSVAKAKAPGIVTGRYGSLGQFTLVEQDYWPLNTALYSIELYKNKPRFIWYLLQSVSELFLLNSFKAAVPGIDRNDIHEITVTAPNPEEQNEIIEFLDQQCNRISFLTVKTQNSITLLKERRSALITAAVTGQIDLREAA